MGRYLSAEESKAEHLALGPELGPVYHSLWNEVAWLHFKWRQYVQLFDSSKERIEILNEGASLFFRLVQDSLWEDTLLHLSALTDPEKTGKKENLTLRRLPALVADLQVRRRIQEAVDAAVVAAEFARDWRNRRIAHRDFALALASGAEPLAPASRARVCEAVQKVCDVIRQVSLGCRGSDIYYGEFSEPNDGLSMLYTLRAGIEAERSRRERLRAGQPVPEDLDPPRAL